MSDIDDGERAFPGEDDEYWYFGMSVREYYAGQFLTTIRPHLADAPAAHARKAVKYADALIAALKEELAHDPAPSEPTAEGPDADGSARRFAARVMDQRAELATLRDDLARMKAAMETCRSAVKPLTYMRGIPVGLDPSAEAEAWREHVKQAREGASALLNIIDAALKETSP